MLHREGIQPSSLFPAVTTASPTSAWMKKQRCRKMTRCAVWRCPSWATIQQMALLSMTTAFCYSSLASFFVVFAPWWGRSHISPCYLHGAVIILRAPSSLHIHFDILQYLRLRALQYRRSVMNKLSIRVKAETYTQRSHVFCCHFKTGRSQRNMGENASSQTQVSGCKWAAIGEHLNNL